MADCSSPLVPRSSHLAPRISHLANRPSLHVPRPFFEAVRHLLRPTASTRCPLAGARCHRGYSPATGFVRKKKNDPGTRIIAPLRGYRDVFGGSAYTNVEKYWSDFSTWIHFIGFLILTSSQLSSRLSQLPTNSLPSGLFTGNRLRQKKKCP